MKKSLIIGCFMVLLLPCLVLAAPEIKRNSDGFTITESVTDEFISQIKDEKGQLPAGKLVFRLSKVADADLVKLCAAFPEMTSLSISDSKTLASLAPLAEMKSLLAINVDNVAVSDLAPLGGLITVQSLSLKSDTIKDVTPLASLTRLHSLSLKSNALRDLAPLASLTNLQSLTVDCEFDMPDMKWMSGMTRIGTLNINNSGRNGGYLSSLEGLPRLTLRSVDLNGAGIKPTDLTPLVNALPDLQTLNFRYTILPDLTPLSKLANLTKLNMYGAVVKDFSPLAQCPKLKVLNYYAVTNADFNTLGALTQVEEFDGGLTKLDDISWIVNLPKLTKLRLFAEYITDYSPLSKTNIRHLTIWSMRTPVGDLAALKGMKSLTYLKLWDLDDLTNFAALGSISSLEELELAKTNSKSGEAIDLGFVSKLVNLKTFTISDTANLANLNNPKVLDGIKGLPKIQKVTLPKNIFSEEQLKGFPANVLNLR